MNLKLPRRQQARLDFIEGLKSFVATDLVPCVRQDYQTWCSQISPPADKLRNRQFMHQRFGRNATYQASRGLQRISQEAMWAEVISGLSGQRDTIRATLSAPNGAPGSLTLNPALAMPPYYDATEFHLQPGSYHHDELAGPIYELGVAAYTLHRYGRGGDEMGQALLSVLPDTVPKKTLYLGCGPAYKSYPIIDAFPSAQHHAIDLAAPMLRYARWRAAQHGKPIHFHQMNAESLDFDDNQFDLVFCKLLLHEVPAGAISNIVSEVARILKPGGIFANLELPGYDSLDPLSAYLMDWDTDHNGEPYWRAYHEMDIVQTFVDAGLSTGLVDADSAWGGGKGNYMGKFSYHITLGTKPARAS